MKAYPISEGELHELAYIGVFAAASFSIAAACVSFAVDIHKDLALSVGPPLDEVAFWGAIRLALFAVSAALTLIGAGLVWRGHSRISKIKKSTIFDNDAASSG